MKVSLKHHQISTRFFWGVKFGMLRSGPWVHVLFMFYMFCSAAGGILKFYSDDSPGLKVGPTTVRSFASQDLQAMVKHGEAFATYNGINGTVCMSQWFPTKLLRIHLSPATVEFGLQHVTTTCDVTGNMARTDWGNHPNFWACLGLEGWTNRPLTFPFLCFADFLDVHPT